MPGQEGASGGGAVGSRRCGSSRASRGEVAGRGCPGLTGGHCTLGGKQHQPGRRARQRASAIACHQ